MVATDFLIAAVVETSLNAACLVCYILQMIWFPRRDDGSAETSAGAIVASVISSPKNSSGTIPNGGVAGGAAAGLLSPKSGRTRTVATPTASAHTTPGVSHSSGGNNAGCCARGAKVSPVKWWLHLGGIVFGVLSVFCSIDRQGGLGVWGGLTRVTISLAPYYSCTIFQMYSIVVYFSLTALYKQIRSEPPLISRYIITASFLLIPFGSVSAGMKFVLNRQWPDAIWIIAATFVLDTLLAAFCYVVINLNARLKSFIANQKPSADGTYSIDTAYLEAALRKLWIFFWGSTFCIVVASFFLLLTAAGWLEDANAEPFRTPESYLVGDAIPDWCQCIGNIVMCWYSWEPRNRVVVSVHRSKAGAGDAYVVHKPSATSTGAAAPPLVIPRSGRSVTGAHAIGTRKISVGAISPMAAAAASVGAGGGTTATTPNHLIVVMSPTNHAVSSPSGGAREAVTSPGATATTPTGDTTSASSPLLPVTSTALVTATGVGQPPGGGGWLGRNSLDTTAIAGSGGGVSGGTDLLPPLHP